MSDSALGHRCGRFEAFLAADADVIHSQNTWDHDVGFSI